MTEENERKFASMTALLQELIDADDWEKAKYLGEYCVKLSPENPDCRRALGLALLELGELDASERELVKALECGNDSYGTFLLLATISCYRGDTESERVWLETMLEREPDNRKALSRLATICIGCGEIKKAESLLSTLIRSHPDDARAYTALTDLYILDRRPDAAEEILREALQRCDASPDLYNELGRILGRKGEHKEALQCFIRACELDDNYDPDQFYNIGDTLLALGDPGQAVTYLNRAAALAPFDPVIRYDLSRAYFDLGRYPECLAAGRAAISYDPAMESGRTNLGLSAMENIGLAHMHLGDYEEAEACFTKNIQLVAPAYFNLGLCQFRQKKYEESLANFLRATEIDPGDAEYQDLLGNAYLELGRLSEAKAALEKAIAADEKYAPAQYDLGVVFSRMDGQDDLAMEYYERAKEIDDTAWLAYYGIACVHAKRNRKELALDYLDNAIRHGFNDLQYLDSDGDFDGLREDPDFLRIRGTVAT